MKAKKNSYKETDILENAILEIRWNELEITACPKCGSKRIFQGSMGDGLLSGYTSNYVCKECGYKGMPFIFDNEIEYKKFITAHQKEKQK